MTDPTLYQRPAELLQRLIRFDTTNPPGNEAACIQYLSDLLQAAGIETTLLAKDENRPNLIARLKGSGDAPPLLLQGHVDVVTTADQEWAHDPFGGELHDGYVWGRGALDMKGGVSMMVAAFLRAKLENVTLPGDVILTILADEEAGGIYGARFLVEEHPEQFADVQYALGEFGGFSMALAGSKFYPIMVAEKQHCHLQMVVRGPGGHGSRPFRGGAMARLGRLLSTLDQTRLPVHVTPAVEMMVKQMGEGLPAQIRPLIQGLLNPATTDQLIDSLGDQGQMFEALFHNTVNATIVHGGHKINVIPGEIVLQLDGRLLPGLVPDQMLAELRDVVDDSVAIELLHFDPGPAAPNMGLFDTLAGILHDVDPQATSIPLVLPGVTDARFFSRLGIQTYGFLPMQLPSDFTFISTIHAADERIPAEAVAFGANAVFQALQRFGDAP